MSAFRWITSASPRRADLSATYRLSPLMTPSGNSNHQATIRWNVPQHPFQFSWTTSNHRRSVWSAHTNKPFKVASEPIPISLTSIRSCLTTPVQLDFPMNTNGKKSIVCMFQTCNTLKRTTLGVSNRLGNLASIQPIGGVDADHRKMIKFDGAPSKKGRK